LIQGFSGVFSEQAPNTLFASEARQIVIEIVQNSRSTQFHISIIFEVWNLSSCIFWALSLPREEHLAPANRSHADSGRRDRWRNRHLGVSYGRRIQSKLAIKGGLMAAASLDGGLRLDGNAQACYR
jgi:hypothetical protein